MMIKYLIKNLLAITVFFYGSLGLAMKPALEETQNFEIVFKNNLNRRIQFSWINNFGKEASNIIAANDFYAINAKNIHQHSKLRFEVYGEWLAFTAVSKEISTEDLRQQWLQLKQNSADKLEVQITSSYGGVKIEVSYTILTEKLTERQSTKNVLELFPQLKYYGFDKKFTSPEILSFGNANQTIIPAGRIIGSETKAGDIYRYILDLGKTYTADDVKAAYKKKSFEYHPDKLQGNVELANEAFRLITKAKDGLLKALEEKELGGEWVDIQPDSPRKSETAESSQTAVAVAKEDEL